MDIKPILKPENSIVAGLATVAVVYSIYEMNLGNTASVHATDVDASGPHPALASSVKKAGWEALGLVAAITLLARDPNILILGGAAIIACDVHYKHAMMVSPQTGQLQIPGPQSYQAAA